MRCTLSRSSKLKMWNDANNLVTYLQKKIHRTHHILIYFVNFLIHVKDRFVNFYLQGSNGATEAISSCRLGHVVQ